MEEIRNAIIQALRNDHNNDYEDNNLEAEFNKLHLLEKLMILYCYIFQEFTDDELKTKFFRRLYIGTCYILENSSYVISKYRDTMDFDNFFIKDFDDDDFNYFNYHLPEYKMEINYKGTICISFKTKTITNYDSDFDKNIIPFKEFTDVFHPTYERRKKVKKILKLTSES